MTLRVLPELARTGAFDVLLLDMNFAAGADDGAEGLKRLAEVLMLDPQAVVVLVTAHSGVELAVQAMKQGAADFVTKPWENERLARHAPGRGQSAPLTHGDRSAT